MSRLRLLALLPALLAASLPAGAAEAAPTITGPVSALPAVEPRVGAPWALAQGLVRGEDPIVPAGDVNGDGRADALVHIAKPGLAAVYVVFGAPGAGPVQLETIGARGFYVWRSTTTRLRARALGDVTGDGRDDLNVGGWLVYGRTATTPINLAALHPSDGRPGAESRLPVGDVNGDGHVDHIENGIDATNGTNVWLGTPGDAPATQTLRIFRPLGGPCGREAVPTPAGDVNGDGRDDLVVSATRNLSLTNSTMGARTCVLYGRGAGTIDTTTFSSTGLGFEINVGYHVPWPNLSGFNEGATPAAGVGDIDGDGFDDIAIARSWEDPLGRSNAGAVLVVRGGNRSGLVDARTTNRLSLLGTVPGAELGQEPVFGIGDVTGDGRGEVVLSDQSGNLGFSVSGRPLTGSLDLANMGATGLRVTDAQIAGPIGDFDGDGTTDIATRGRILLTGAL